MPINAPFPYFGGKGWMIERIQPLLDHVTGYVDPFFGAGAILLSQPKGTFVGEIVGDMNGLLVNFFRSVAHDTEAICAILDRTTASEHDLHAAIRELTHTNENVEMQTRLSSELDYHNPRAAALYYLYMRCAFPNVNSTLEANGTGKAPPVIKNSCTTGSNPPMHVGKTAALSMSCVPTQAPPYLRNPIDTVIDGKHRVTQNPPYYKRQTQPGDVGVDSTNKAGVNPPYHRRSDTNDRVYHKHLRQIADRLERCTIMRCTWGDTIDAAMQDEHLAKVESAIGAKASWKRVNATTFRGASESALLFLDPPYGDKAGTRNQDGKLYVSGAMDVLQNEVEDRAIEYVDHGQLAVIVCGHEERPRLAAAGYVLLGNTRRKNSIKSVKSRTKEEDEENREEYIYLNRFAASILHRDDQLQLL